jgi:hypothetical protein
VFVAYRNQYWSHVRPSLPRTRRPYVTSGSGLTRGRSAMRSPATRAVSASTEVARSRSALS